MLEGRVWPQKGQEIDSTGWARIEDRHIETDTERRKNNRQAGGRTDYDRGEGTERLERQRDGEIEGAVRPQRQTEIETLCTSVFLYAVFAAFGNSLSDSTHLQ
jgi:hypothetical protein